MPLGGNYPIYTVIIIPKLNAHCGQNACVYGTYNNNCASMGYLFIYLWRCSPILSTINIYFLHFIYFCTRFILFGVPSDRIKSQKTAVLAKRTVRVFPSTEHYQVCWPPRLIHSLYSQRYWGKLCWPTLCAGMVLHRTDVVITFYNKTDAPISQIYFLEYNSTCFGQVFCPSSGV